MNIQIDQTAGATESWSRSGCKILIAIPFYKNEGLVRSVVGSLMSCADDIAAIGGAVILFNDSPDYPALGDALAAILPEAQAAFPCRLIDNQANLGFVKTMNKAVAEAVTAKADLLLLNSDTIVYPGALTEMARVARLDPMIAFVNPRSDNATLATLPAAHRRGEAQKPFDLSAYTALAARLPDFSYVPTAVGFCMLIRWHILAEFGGFDEAFGAGYNEENDLVMRAGRCGYRAVLANKAFVQHEGEKSFSIADVPKTTLERINRAMLDERYPEYDGNTSAYFLSPEFTGEWLLSTLVPDDAGRLDLAFDFSSFPPEHSGTYKAGRQLLEPAVRDWSDRFNIHVLCTEEAYDFHKYAELGVPRRDPDGPERFAVVFRVGQPFTWRSMERLIRKGPVIGIYMLDTISLDCTQLTSPDLQDIWQFALSRCDLLVTPSKQSMTQVTNRFRIPERVVRAESLHSMDLVDYALTDAGAERKKPGAWQGNVLVIGNHFPHKYLVPTANALAEAFPDRKIMALGQTKPNIAQPFNPYGLPSLSPAVNLVGAKVGHFTDAEFSAFYLSADVIVFPSHYEGFGLPLLNALAARRPIFVRRLPVFEELWERLARNPNVHFYETTADLTAQLQVIPTWKDLEMSPRNHDGAARSAHEIGAAIDMALARAQYSDIVERVRAMRLLNTLSGNSGAPEITPAPNYSTAEGDKAAYYLAVRVEWLARRLFRQPAVFALSRLAFRLAVRPLLRIRRRLRRR
ncbi:MAG TPA: glycosyltransferase [Alphaproteobacteria bacterium]|nr:glycosyltransferase [Alphaproteobacteria bacterium]